ncbi:MAG TPA: sigma-70 family RNA polymerase sigma factor [Longimicrobiales bacterium]|nr:sigma-70 family RNA polymerase sigma factor [Longimicrobiales bacterium]
MRHTSTDLTDRELAGRVLAQGDESAFRALYRRHSPRAYAMALRSLDGASDLADDVLQEAWLRAVRSLDGFEWRSAFGSWLCSIVLNCAREQRRRLGRRNKRELLGPGLSDDASYAGAALEVATAPATGVATAGDRIDLRRALAELPDGYRTVLMLHDVEGYTHAEIGEMLGIAPGTSKSQLHQARRAMRQLLSPPGEERT